MASRLPVAAARSAPAGAASPRRASESERRAAALRRRRASAAARAVAAKREWRDHGSWPRCGAVALERCARKRLVELQGVTRR